ncbi:MAG: ribosome-binding ATPase YchF [Candidatus Tectimicrobiota bacterium]|nr:MAG: ribosome-binding ATPase YchF [Candidatus Tectomicrobia bacterium]
MQIGILGLPASGKTTVFRALTGAGQRPRRGELQADTRIVPVPDARLPVLAAMYRPRKVTPATLEFIDPLVEGAPSLRHYVDSLLPLLRSVEALAHVLRAFEDAAVPHPLGSVDPLRDVRRLNEELLLADLAVVEKRCERLAKDLKKTQDRTLAEEYALLQRCRETLEAGEPLRRLALTAAEEKRLRGFGFLSSKPQLLVLNLDEAAIPREAALLAEFTARLPEPDVEVLPLYGKLEQEIAELAPEDAAAFRRDLGLKAAGLERFVQKCFSLLRRSTFFTANENEVRAWTVPQGTSALEAAGVIHSDMARGFIRAEVVSFDDLAACGSPARAREAGKLRLEGKEYAVQDGDVLYIRFHV